MQVASFESRWNINSLEDLVSYVGFSGAKATKAMLRQPHGEKKERKRAKENVTS